MTCNVKIPQHYVSAGRFRLRSIMEAFLARPETPSSTTSMPSVRARLAVSHWTDSTGERRQSRSRVSVTSDQRDVIHSSGHHRKAERDISSCLASVVSPEPDKPHIKKRVAMVK